MIERVLKELASLDGVQRILLVEMDGFVVHAHPNQDGIEPSTVQAWLALIAIVHRTIPHHARDGGRLLDAQANKSAGVGDGLRTSSQPRPSAKCLGKSPAAGMNISRG